MARQKLRSNRHVLSEALHTSLRLNINITWSDEDTDNKIKMNEESGIAFLDSIAGGPIDFESDAESFQLLCDYCRYAFANSLNEFKVNYQDDLVALYIRMMKEETNG